MFFNLGHTLRLCSIALGSVRVAPNDDYTCANAMAYANGNGVLVWSVGVGQ